MARYAEDAKERSTCPACRGPLDECSDAEKVWYPQRQICHKKMELEAATRKWHELHKEDVFHDGTRRSWRTERSDSHPYHYNDGVRLWASEVDYDPEGTWLSQRESACGPQDRVGGPSTAGVLDGETLPLDDV